MTIDREGLVSALQAAADTLDMLTHPDHRDGDLDPEEHARELRLYAQSIKDEPAEPERNRPEMHKRVRVSHCSAKLRIPADQVGEKGEEVLFECQGHTHDAESWHHSKGNVHLKGGRALEYTISWRELGRRQLHVSQ